MTLPREGTGIPAPLPPPTAKAQAQAGSPLQRAATYSEAVSGRLK